MTVRWLSLWRAAFAVLLTSSLASIAFAQDAATGGDQTAAADRLEENPLLTEPRTPETLFDAVVLMSDLARPNLAFLYLQKLMDANPNDATLLKLRDKHGPAIFLRLSNDKRLQPESIQLLDRVNAAFRKGARDPARVDKLIADLTKTAAQREVAILQLRNAGVFAAARIVSVLDTAKEDAHRKLLLYTLTRLSREVVPVLLGAVEAPNVDLRATVIEALGWLGDRQAVPALWHPAFEPSQPAGVQLAARQALARLLFGSTNRTADVTAFGAVSELAKSARQHLRGNFEWSLNDEGLVEMWSWDTQSGSVTMTPVTIETASMIVGTRQARQAFELSPERVELHALYWVALMASELHEAGRGAAIRTEPGSTFHLGLQLGPDVMQPALTEAIQLEQSLAAVAALQALSQTANAHLLKAAEGKPAPVVAALNHPDPRVQFAAASTILTWDPPTSFRGVSRVVEVLARNLADSGKARGVVIDAGEARATEMAAALSELGFEPEAVSTGQEGFKIAAEHGDVGLFLIEANVARWELSQTIANLRADARTAYIPIVIYGGDKTQPRIERIAESYPRVRFALSTGSTADMKRQVTPFLKPLQADTLTQTQRAATKRAALFWLTQLADRRQATIFDLKPAENVLFAAANDADLAEQAVFSLGAIGTSSAQTKLFEIATAASRSVLLRDRALAQLTAHIHRHGLLLKEMQVAELKQAARQEVDPQLKTSFAAALGSLHPDRRQSSQLLKSVPSSRATLPRSVDN